MEKVVRMAGLLLDSAPFGSSSGSKYSRDQDEGGDPTPHTLLCFDRNVQEGRNQITSLPACWHAWLKKGHRD